MYKALPDTQHTQNTPEAQACPIAWRSQRASFRPPGERIFVTFRNYMTLLVLRGTARIPLTYCCQWPIAFHLHRSRRSVRCPHARVRAHSCPFTRRGTHTRPRHPRAQPPARAARRTALPLIRRPGRPPRNASPPRRDRRLRTTRRSPRPADRHPRAIHRLHPLPTHHARTRPASQTTLEYAAPPHPARASRSEE